MSTCEHLHTITTITAGLARTVCEECGRVSISYERAGALWPDGPEAQAYAGHEGPEDLSEIPYVSESLDSSAASETARPPRPKAPICSRCSVTAVYLTPWGLACGDHAWEAASLQDPLSDTFWIPLLVDRTNIAN